MPQPHFLVAAKILPKNFYQLGTPLFLDIHNSSTKLLQGRDTKTT